MAGAQEIDRFFDGRPRARRLFAAVERAVRAAGPSTRKVGQSQIAYARRRGFAWVWTPGRWLRGSTIAPLVLSLALPRRDRSRRWKEVVEPRPGRWMHHLELRVAGDLDHQVMTWLQEAWDQAR